MSFYLIETDAFPFEFLSRLALHESWRKELHRPIYHIHKWWGTRLGSVFRGIILACCLDRGSDLEVEFYKNQYFYEKVIFDPFMGSGTVVGEAHKLGLRSLGRDINPVAVRACRVAFGPLDRFKMESSLKEIEEKVGEKIRNLYRYTGEDGVECEVIYYFWVMSVKCHACQKYIDLFPSYIISENVNKINKKILCPKCEFVFDGFNDRATCSNCSFKFNPRHGILRRGKATCPYCHYTFLVKDVIQKDKEKPRFRLFAKVIQQNGKKRYIKADRQDIINYEKCVEILKKEEGIVLPALHLAPGHNTRQAISYNFRQWVDFFNDRQLLTLGWLQSAIFEIDDQDVREAFLVLFSELLEFNNLFASYKGEGTGAVRGIFSSHILKPEYLSAETNIFSKFKNSGSLINLFRNKVLRTINYKINPTELHPEKKKVVCSPPFEGQLSPWPIHHKLPRRAIAISCGDSATTGLPDRSVDLVVTDPPFFDHIHYSELADFFYAWQQLSTNPYGYLTTRSIQEVQDVNLNQFCSKLAGVFLECHRILKDNGLFVFTYHHARDEAWVALAQAILSAGFVVVNAHPVQSEMRRSISTLRTRQPIYLDAIIVCRKRHPSWSPQSAENAIASAQHKIMRMINKGFHLSEKEKMVIIYSQFLTSLDALDDLWYKFNSISKFIS